MAGYNWMAALDEYLASKRNWRSGGFYQAHELLME
jgi:hypothetical protein